VEWTISLVQRVVSEMLNVRSVVGHLPSERLEDLAKDVKYYEARNRKSRRSHEKRTRCALRAHGVRLSDVMPCPRLC